MLRFEQCILNKDIPGSKVGVVRIAADPEIMALFPPVEEYTSTDPIFWVETYRYLAVKWGDERWTSVLGPANDFMATLPFETQKDLYGFYRNCRVLLANSSPEAFRSVIEQITDHFTKVVVDHRLSARTIAYVEAGHLPIPDLSAAGSRAHDTDELTFKEPHYQKLTAISVLCKMLCPIYGHIVHHMKETMGNVNKEMFCSMIILPTLESLEFLDIYEKLNNYIMNGVRSYIKKFRPRTNGDVNFICAHGGFSEERLCQNILGVILVKKFSIVNYFAPEGCNLMKYVSVNINATLDSQLKNLQDDGLDQKRDILLDKDDRGSDNVTLLEHDSRVSTSTLDIPIVVRVGITMAIKRILEEYNIPKQAYNQAISYYTRELVVVSYMTRTIVASLLGRKIGGTYGLNYLDMKTYLPLIVITQIHLIRTGKPQIAHLITANTSLTTKEEASSVIDSRILLNYTLGSHYRKCAEKFSYALDGKKSFVKQMSELVKWTVSYPHYGNTAPSLIEMIPEGFPSPERGAVIEYDESIIQQVCQFFVEQHVEIGS